MWVVDPVAMRGVVLLLYFVRFRILLILQEVGHDIPCIVVSGRMGKKLPLK